MKATPTKTEPVDLFGQPLVETKPRKGVPAGHADVPGYGPEGQTCGSCGHVTRIEGHNRNYYKCELIRASWTSGYGTDVRCKDPACRLWKARAKET